MFEGVVSQVLAGYLGRYVKGIQKDQLKIGIWNEEVLLENVELILEAFDYLQLPFALKNGRVGKLSIKIPWKKLGWEPIIVVLEDVFICACQREDNEWSSDSVERRELAGQMAKLNAVELAKFSRCVSDNQAGQSFISYISAKILDSIQVSIRNVHIIYIDSHNDQEKFIFGLKFSSLTIMTDTQKQSSTMSSSGKFRGGQVNKIVEISTVGLYCNLFEENQNLLGFGYTGDFQFYCKIYDYLVNPFDVTVYMLANKSGKLDGAPQYAITAELSSLVVSLNEIQLRQILSLWDYLTICALREKFGRYRPSQNSLSMKLNGWQKMWWHYAQNSVLADVRWKLRKTSWSYLGRRINERRKYVNLYRRKLELLQQEQLVNRDILHELEKMDKECDIDDILNYRSTAEHQLQELLSNSKSCTTQINDATSVLEKQQNDERSSSRARGWLNWLSLGMLGAGGTADSSSFAGVVSDEIIKDIHEATSFHPAFSSDEDSLIRDKFCLSSIKLNICQIIISISTKRHDRKIAKAIVGGISTECKFWEDSAAIVALIDSVKIINPSDENVMLVAKKAMLVDSLSEDALPFINVQVNMPQSIQNFQVSVKVVLRPFEATYESNFFLDLFHFYQVYASFQFQHNRVISSLNGFKDFKARLLSKAEYVSFTRKRLNWDVSLDNVIIKLPSLNTYSEALLMVLELEALSLRSFSKTECGPQMLDSGHCYNFISTTCLTDSTDSKPLNFQLEDLYDHFEIGLTGFGVRILMSNLTKAVSVIEKFNTSVTFGLCIFLDEPMLKQLEINCSVSSLGIHFSPAISNAFIGLYGKLSERKSEALAESLLEITEYDEPDNPCSFQFSVSVKLDKFSFHVDLEDDAENGSSVSIILGDVDIRYTLREYIEFWILVKMVMVDAYSLKNESSSYMLCSSRNSSGGKSPHVHVEYVGLNLPGVNSSGSSSSEGCFQLHYQAYHDGFIIHRDCYMCLNDVDLHIYPRIFGMVQNFFDRLNMQTSVNHSENSFRLSQKSGDTKAVGFELPNFGFSNFYDTKLTASTSIPVDRFPFVTISNSGSLSSLEGSIILGVPELKSLYVKDRQFPRRQKLNVRKRSRNLNSSTVNSASSGAVNLSENHSHFTQFVMENHGHFTQFVMDFNLNGVRAHFHDSSCILGTITLPASKSSLSFQDTDCWDVLFSVDGLMLTSSWSPPNIHELLWGPSLPSTSPVLNIRVRKDKRKTLLPLTEICIGIQHVCCILPSDFLAMVIGYFSLPDWTFKGNRNFNNENDDLYNSQNTNDNLLYKFEILDCTLIFPVEGHTDYCLQLEFPQLYCSFNPMSSSADAVQDIALECLIPVSTSADRLTIINVFGRSTSISLLLLGDDANFLLKLDEYTSNRNIPLITQLDADLWIRIPCGTTCSDKQSSVHPSIMMRSHICDLTAEDEYFFCGLEAAVGVVDQLSSVGKESKMFQSDVLQFLQLKMSLKGASDVSIDISNGSFVSMKFCVKALSIKFMRLRVENSTLSEIVAKVDMRLNFSALLKNEILQSLVVDIPLLFLYSFHSYVPLASFISDSNLSSHLCINFSRSDGGKSEVLLAIPFLDIWLHLSDWNNIIGLLCSYKRQPGSTSCSSCRSSQSGSHSVPDSLMSPCFASEYVMQEVVTLTINSENISLSFHLPMWDEEDGCTKIEIDGVPKFYSLELPYQMSADSLLPSEPKHCQYVNFTLQSKYCELTVGNSYVRLKCNVEKMRAILEMIHNHKVSSIPFVHISLIKVGTELSRKQGELLHIFSEVQVESFDVGLSHQIFNFWSCCQFNVPQTGSSWNLCHCMAFKVHLKKGSLLLSDGRWSYHGPILEILMKNMLVQSKQTEDVLEASAIADLLANYNNIDKVMWEPFIEPWCFQLNLVRKCVGNALLTASATTDVSLNSTQQLNLNITEPLIEAIFRLHQMIKDALSQNGVDSIQESRGVFGFQTTDDIRTRRYAPYILRNDTSLPLTFHVSRGIVSADDADSFPAQDENIVQPGFSVPIYVEETLDEQFLRHRTGHSSERLMEKKLGAVAHHMISIQLDGTSGPSKPMSMDLVGLSYFEVNFSKNKASMIEVDKDDYDASGSRRKLEERFRSDQNNGLIVPVVFEVSMQNYSKLIRLYSTVILFNATSMPLELRFDIPFGVSPKILDPVLPEQEIPLPLHLAETGRMRWRPVGSNYLWSEAHSLSNMLSQENKLGFFRSFVCYPSHPSSDPFRCCISVQDYSLSSSCGARKRVSLNIHRIERLAVDSIGQRLFKPDSTKKHFIHQVRLTTPLLVKSYLPVGLSLMVDSGGVAHSFSLSEVDTASVFLVDSAHDLGITFHLNGFRPIISKFPRAESFSGMAKLDGSKFSISETLTFYPDSSGGPVCVSLEKAMDAFCGAREICLSVPFLLYNCTGLLLTIIDNNHEKKGSSHVIPSCYHMIGHKELSDRKHGLALLLSEFESLSGTLDVNSSVNSFSKERILSTREKVNLYSHVLSTRHFQSSISYMRCFEYSSNNNLDARGASQHSSVDGGIVSNPLYLSGKVGNDADYMQNGGSGKVKAYMYGPLGYFPATELMVKLCASLPQGGMENTQNPTWSSPFSLVPASGSTNVVIPKPCSSGAFLVSVTSIPVAGELSGRSRAITFQPRFVICNACNKDLYCKQKGTNIFHHLSIGQHSDLHWSDTTRELLVSIRFNEPGWQWSGSFLPDCLGDAQVKMRNYVSGASSMVRVEVQNADLTISNEKIIRNSNGNSMTQLILLSDDKSGFMPYRIDNFSMERLRVYQQRCESFETIVHSYTSCQYAWDEPCYPHRLIVEVPGERIVGTYSLDDVKEYGPVLLPSTSEKPERRLHISIHAEGAIKVLNIIDSSYHIVKDMKEAGFLGFKEKKEFDQIQDYHAKFSEMITLHLPFIGISLINSSPQELIYACAKETTVVVMQSLDQQKISFQISSLQIDNQFSDTPYPIMLSFNNEHRGKSTNIVKDKDNKLRIQNESINSSACDSTSERIFYLAAAKWRNTDTSLVSFKYINLGLAPLCIELEEQILLGLFDFFRTVSSRLQSRALQKNFGLWTPDYGADVPMEYPALAQDNKCKQNNLLKVSETQKNNQLLPSVVPIGAPWQQIYLLARRQRKIYVEVFELAPIKLSLSFSSTPWMIRNEVQSEVDAVTHISSTILQRGLMALVDIEGVPVHLGELSLEHLMASQDSIQDILIRHYTRQLLHEMYKVLGSAGVIGNPMGFARNVGLGIKDFLSVSSKGVLQSPAGLLTGIAEGSKSLLSNTVYAISSATTQFSKAAHKGIVAFTFDEQAVAEMDELQKSRDSHGKGVLDGILEGLTGLLQSPIRGAEKHGLPGVLSGIAMGTAGLVARPMASILEATGKTAQSIRNRSSPHQSNRFRIRFPRPLARELPLLPYSWEEAIGVSMLLQADGSRLRGEIFVMCKALKQAGKFIVITERLVLAVWCSCLVGLGTPEFVGVATDPGWVIETEMSLENVVHIDRTEEVVNIVGSSAETPSRQRKGSTRNRPWSSPVSAALFHMSVELPSMEEAEDVLQVLLSTIEQGKERRWGVRVLHRLNLR